jgi:hypothetical protein
VSPSGRRLAVSTTLRLQVTEFTDLTRWRWTLTDGTGAFLADHEVRLDPPAEHFEAFADLRGYVSWHAAPDRYPADEARIVTRLGDWIGTETFGDAIGSKLVERRPATVQVILPPDAEALAYLPLETARLRGRSLAGHDLTLIMQPGTVGTPAKTPVANVRAASPRTSASPSRRRDERSRTPVLSPRPIGSERSPKPGRSRWSGGLGRAGTR